MRPSSSSPNGQSGCSVLRWVSHALGPRLEAQPAQHINGHHSPAAHDATAAGPSQSAAAGPAARTARAQSATAAAASAAAHGESGHSAYTTGQHGDYDKKPLIAPVYVSV